MKNKTRLAIIIFLAIVFFAIPFLPEKEKRDMDAASVCIKEKCFVVEVADTPSERESGLMNRNELAQDAGMLFKFENEDNYRFWMKNTLIRLDIIWISKENRIVYIKENAEPCKSDPCESFDPDAKAKYVLEINGGLSKKMGFGAGDVVEFKQ